MSNFIIEIQEKYRAKKDSLNISKPMANKIRFCRLTMISKST